MLNDDIPSLATPFGAFVSNKHFTVLHFILERGENSTDTGENSRAQTLKVNQKKKEICPTEVTQNSSKVHKRKKTHEPEKKDEERPSKKRKYIKEDESSKVSTLTEKVREILEQIKVGHAKANVKSIFEAYKAFQALQFDENIWETLAKHVNAYRWPSQKTWKDVVGGHLFFPDDLDEWYVYFFHRYDDLHLKNVNVYNYLLKRLDYIWTYAIGTKFGNPITTLLLRNISEDIWNEYNLGLNYSILEEEYKNAVHDLEQCLGHPDARYVLASQKPIKEAYDLCREGNYKTLYQALLIRDYSCNHVDQSFLRELTDFPPRIQDFYNFAVKHKFGLAYLRAVLKVESPQNYSILKRIGKAGYSPVWVKIGDFYLEEANIKKARKYYRKAADAGLSMGGIKLANTYVGNRAQVAYFEYPAKSFEDISQDDFDEAVKWFKWAGENKNQEGYEHLIYLYRAHHEYARPLSKSLSEKKKTKEEITEKWDEDDMSVTLPMPLGEKVTWKSGPYDKDIIEALEEGIKLGSTRCYQWARSLHNETGFHRLITTYGYSLHYKNFLLSLDKVIKKDDYFPSFLEHYPL